MKILEGHFDHYAGRDSQGGCIVVGDFKNHPELPRCPSIEELEDFAKSQGIELSWENGNFSESEKSLGHRIGFDDSKKFADWEFAKLSGINTEKESAEFRQGYYAGWDDGVN